MLNIFVRADGGGYIGSGHLYRCLNLISYIHNCNVEFISKINNNDLINLINNNYKLHLLDFNKNYKITKDKSTWLNDNQVDDAKKTIEIIKKCNVDWLIIDHYTINKEWEDVVRPFVKKIFVIDDYTNRKHNCDFILNNLLTDKSLYNNLVDESCQILYGKNNIILSKIYLQKFLLNKSNKLNRINILMGGSDKTNETLRIMNLCQKINKNIKNKITFDVIVGSSNNNKDVIEEFCHKDDNFNFFFNINNLHQIYLKSQLAIGSCGINMFEKCILSIPTLLFCVDKEQEIIINDIINSGSVNYIGNYDDIYENKLSEQLLFYYNNPLELQKMKIKSNEYLNINHLKDFEFRINKIFNNI